MKTNLFSVIGHPVSHSLSPELFNTFLNETGTNGQYIRASGYQLSSLLAMLKELDVYGFNVTKPYKESIISRLSYLTAEAQEIGAVNTVTLDTATEKLTGRNTDHFGVLQSLLYYFPTLQGKPILVVGAGGAAKAAVFSLKKAGASVHITNRNPGRGQAVSHLFSVPFHPLKEISSILPDFDILIWTIPTYPAGLKLELHAGQLVLDANYRISPNNTYFGQAKRLDGLHWLIHQGWKSFCIFDENKATKKVPDFDVILRRMNMALRSAFPDIIVLTGFMGAGKSTIGRVLADKLGWDFFDTDRMCETEAGKTVKKIFLEDGERGFRKLETEQTLKVLCGRKKVIALGGGAVCTPEIRHRLRKSAFTVWLYQTPEVIGKRCSGHRERPLFSVESFRKLLKKRVPLYLGTSDLIVDSTGASVEEFSSFLSSEIHFLY